MSNEPVAFVSKEDLKNMKTHLCYLHLKPQKNDIPLYTHPAKTLTDEEINKLWAESHEDGIAMQQGFTTQQHYFAHLILKKASEK